MTDKTIFIFDAQEGDKLADDVHTPDGNILAKKDTILNYDIIANISGHHILEVKVYDTNNDCRIWKRFWEKLLIKRTLSILIR